MSIGEPCVVGEKTEPNSDGSRGLLTVIDGATGRPIRPRRRMPLRTLNQIANAIARYCRAVHAGEMASDEANRRIYGLGVLAKVREAADLERRIAAIEQQQRELLPGVVERLPEATAND